jgi:hypothetical protein
MAAACSPSQPANLSLERLRSLLSPATEISSEEVKTLSALFKACREQEWETVIKDYNDHWVTLAIQGIQSNQSIHKSSVTNNLKAYAILQFQLRRSQKV